MIGKTGRVSYRFDLDDNTFVFGARPVSPGPVVFDTEELDTPDGASHEAGEPERVLWSTHGPAGDAVELVITRTVSGQIVWAPPSVEEVILPKLPAPYDQLAMGAVTAIEVRNHSADDLDGYAAFVAESTWPLRPSAVVAGRAFTPCEDTPFRFTGA